MMSFQGFEVEIRTSITNLHHKFKKKNPNFSLQIRTDFKRRERNSKSFIFQCLPSFLKTSHLKNSNHFLFNQPPFFFETSQITLILGAQVIKKDDSRID